jgi:hypothetical protein
MTTPALIILNIDIGTLQACLKLIFLAQYNVEKPKWEKGECDEYFSTYHVSGDSWSSFATMNFTRKCRALFN